MSRLSAKNQVTVPVAVLEAAGLRAGDEVVVRAAGPGRVELERVEDLVGRYAGALPFPRGHLDRVRGEWER
jgi:bifunctional DNA-binding transcriptional regulator/antitoxin component of YhaV-PrlF toxin-antitoxin module